MEPQRRDIRYRFYWRNDLQKWQPYDENNQQHLAQNYFFFNTDINNNEVILLAPLDNYIVNFEFGVQHIINNDQRLRFIKIFDIGELHTQKWEDEIIEDIRNFFYQE